MPPTRRPGNDSPPDRIVVKTPAVKTPFTT